MTAPFLHVWRFIRLRGVGAAARAAVLLLGFRRRDWIVTEGFLPGAPAEPAPPGVVFRQATEGDFRRLDALQPHRNPDVLRARVRYEACLLYVAVDGDQVIAFRLVGPRPTRYALFHRLDRYIHLGPGDVFIHEVFTHPDHRNRGIARRLALASDEWLAARGCRRYVSVIRLRNAASFAMAFRKGTRPILHVSSVRFLFFQRDRVSTELPPRVAALLARATAHSAPPPGGRPSS